MNVCLRGAEMSFVLQRQEATVKRKEAGKDKAQTALLKTLNFCHSVDRKLVSSSSLNSEGRESLPDITTQQHRQTQL